MLWLALIIIIFILVKNSTTPKMIITDFNYSKYAGLVREAESGNDYTIENSIGALGAYQFMPRTLNSLKEMFDLPEWKPKENFLGSPSLQDLYFEKLVSSDMEALKNSGIENYLGVIVSGSKNPKYKNITAPANWYGFLGGSHISGAGNVKKFFLFGLNPDDGHTSLSDYVAYFSDKGVS